jgi:hypothetical protein
VRSPFLKIVGATLGTAAAFTAGIVGCTAAVDPPGALTAHLWVDTSGGTCARSSSPAEYADAAACGSLDAANDVCQDADTVLVKGGTYAAQTLTGSNSRTSNCTFRPAEGETVSLPTMNFASTLEATDGPRFVLIDADMRIVATGTDLTIRGNTSDVEIRDFDGANFNIIGALHNKSNITIRGGDWGPCLADDTSSNCNAKIDATVSNVLIDGAYFHDLKCSDHHCLDCTDGTPSCDVHVECLIVFRGVTDLTIRNSKFHDCELMDVFFQNAGCGGIVPGENNDGCPHGTPVRDVLIENNWFGQAWNGQGSKSRGTSLVLDGNNQSLTDWLVRFNSFESGGGIAWNSDVDSTTYSNVRGTGNLDGLTAPQCLAGVTYSYNVFRSSTACSGTGNVGLNAAFPYVDGFGDATMDFHLAGGATSIDDLVPTGVTDGCPADDYDGEARPADTNCDAGADERQ